MLCAHGVAGVLFEVEGESSYCQSLLRTSASSYVLKMGLGNQVIHGLCGRELCSCVLRGDVQGSAPPRRQRDESSSVHSYQRRVISLKHRHVGLLPSVEQSVTARFQPALVSFLCTG